MEKRQWIPVIAKEHDTGIITLANPSQQRVLLDNLWGFRVPKNAWLHAVLAKAGAVQTWGHHRVEGNTVFFPPQILFIVTFVALTGPVCSVKWRWSNIGRKMFDSRHSFISGVVLVAHIPLFSGSCPLFQVACGPSAVVATLAARKQCPAQHHSWSLSNWSIAVSSLDKGNSYQVAVPLVKWRHSNRKIGKRSRVAPFTKWNLV